MNSKYPQTVLRIFYLVMILTGLLLAGCATTPEQKDIEKGAIFYPALPESPRIQYLATFSSSTDVSKPESEFAKFVLGKDANKDAQSINKPYGVKLYNGKIFVVDTRGFGYVIMDLVNLDYKVVTGDGGGRMSKPINITIDRDGNRYITDTNKNQVLVFDKNDRFIQAFGLDQQFKPTDVAISGDQLFVADLKDNEIEVLNRKTGILQYKIGRPGSNEGELYHPTNIKIGPNNHLYVSETTNFRVQEFTLDGRYVKTYGSIGANLGKFARPKGIALDRAGRLYVVDAAFENVQIMDPDGNLLMFFGSPGSNRDNINLPVDIEIDYDNVNLFRKYADPDFNLEYVILVSSQFGVNKVNAYGFGKMRGKEYPEEPAPAKG